MRILFLAALLAAAPTAVIAQDLTPAESQRIDAIVTEALAKSGVPSASIAVVRGGRIVLAKAYGKASETIPVATPALPYQVASNSKQFTAAALLLLEDEGKLSLDDHVSKYLPGISGGDQITIRQLLSHTSGLQDYWPHDYSFVAMSKPVKPQGIIDRWAKKPLDFAPGTQWQYSNTGYVVAGQIVEKVAGQTLFDFLEARIFTPLGMSSVVDQDKAIGPAYPQGYKRFALGPVRVDTPAAPGWLYAAGELSMSASDLAKWNIARMNRSLLPADDWAVQETPVKLTDGKDTGYGLGVSVRQFAGRPMIEHSGESVGFLSENMVFPAQKTSVTVLTNSWFSDAFVQMAQGIARTVLPAPATDPADAAYLAKAQTVFDQLASGTLDRTLLPPPVGDPADAAYLTKAQTVFDQLTSGTLDRALLTGNANYYFDATALADYKSSLGALSKPLRVVQQGGSQPRGGFVARRYRVEYGDRALAISTFSEPGADGRFEQFLVAPTQ